MHVLKLESRSLGVAGAEVTTEGKTEHGLLVPDVPQVAPPPRWAQRVANLFGFG